MTSGVMRQPGRGRLAATRYQSDTGWIVAELDRLELLTPGVEAGAKRDPLTYALAYIERYHGDVLQLEHERAFLSAATLQAWQRGEYAVVTRLVAGLAPILSRMDDLTEAMEVLRLGIDASRRTHDLRQRARFTNRLGGVLSALGRYRQAHQFWYSGLELGRAFGPAAGVWEPLSSFTVVADMLCGYEGADRYASALLRSSATDDDSLAVAFFIRGLFARGAYNLNRAYEDFSHALRLLASTPSLPSPSLQDRQLFTVVVQTEWSRLQDSYARSQAYAESALALAEVFSDRYTVATLLIDQSHFTRQYGSPDDTQAAYLRLRDVARQIRAQHIHTFSRFLERYLASVSLKNPLLPAPSASLSEREIELLRLVAAGCSNAQIGEQLVITPGTVKKHLEHIFTKLDVHNRTAAVARARALHVV